MGTIQGFVAHVKDFGVFFQRNGNHQMLLIGKVRGSTFHLENRTVAAMY